MKSRGDPPRRRAVYHRQVFSAHTVSGCRSWMSALVAVAVAPTSDAHLCGCEPDEVMLKPTHRWNPDAQSAPINAAWPTRVSLGLQCVRL